MGEIRERSGRLFTPAVLLIAGCGGFHPTPKPGLTDEANASIVILGTES